MNEIIVNGRKIRRLIDNDNKKWQYVSFGDWGIRYNKSILFDRPKLKRILHKMNEEVLFTKIYDESFDKIYTDEHVGWDEKYIPVRAAWDTGTAYTCISPELANQLQLDAIRTDNLHTSDGSYSSKRYMVDIMINNQAIYTLKVAEHPFIHKDGVDLLIGMDIISEGDFAISSQNDKTSFSFRIPSKGLIDFTKE